MEFKSGGGGVGVISLPLLNSCKVALDPGFIASIQLIRSSCVCGGEVEEEGEDRFLHHTAAKVPFNSLAPCTTILHLRWSWR